ncbi:hypothetical protein, partial [Streptomyces sp. NPDC059159]
QPSVNDSADSTLPELPEPPELKGCCRPPPSAVPASSPDPLHPVAGRCLPEVRRSRCCQDTWYGKPLG